MPTPQKFFQRDPNGLGRGPGYYYLRGGKRKGSKDHMYVMPDGNIKTITGPYYSKYNSKRDENRLSKGHQINKIGMPSSVARRYAHVTDGDLENNPLVPALPRNIDKPVSGKPGSGKPKSKKKPTRTK